MADDQSQRPYRSIDPPARGQPAKAPGTAPGASASDPLSELARLIGQNDPFSEFGRDGARQPAAPAGVAPDPRAPAAAPNMADHEYFDAPPPLPAQPPMPEAPSFAPPNFGRQAFGGTPLTAGGDLYHVENAAPGYAAAHGGGYEDDPYNRDTAQLAGEEQDFYDDVPPTRRRVGILVIAGIFALAVIGTAGAFGYRALFGSSSSSVPAPVIKADTAPSKIVPAASKDSQSGKQITDRVNDHGMGEKLVSREEQPVAIKDKPAGVVLPQGQDAAQSSGAPVLGSGIVGSEPKRIRTIAIHPDQASADATPVSVTPPPPAPPPPSSAAPMPPPARITPAAPARAEAPAQPPRATRVPPPAADPQPAPAPRSAATRVTPPPVRQAAAAPRNANAPLSLSPDAPAAQARAAAPAMRTAAVAPTRIAPAPAAAPRGGNANAGAGSYAVQVSSQRSEAEAQAAFQSLQGKFPSQLGGKQPMIHRVDLGAKGIYFRAMVGPFATGSEASALCGSLKAAGGSCIIQKN